MVSRLIKKHERIIDIYENIQTCFMIRKNQKKFVIIFVPACRERIEYLISFYFYLSIHRTTIVYFYRRRKKVAFEKKRRKFYSEEKVGL